ncbi:MAG TPA: helix-turn-helix transcriptional regulator [Drouetiella sp.]|jgi:ribosome-binding protein aMBF1 (putative translation factor)
MHRQSSDSDYLQTTSTSSSRTDLNLDHRVSELTHLAVQRQLGQAILKRRTQLNLSQRQLASLSNVHRTYLCEIENGSRNVTIETLNKLAESLGLSLFALVQTAEKCES